jgi:predicted nucleotidyltransferase
MAVIPFTSTQTLKEITRRIVETVRPVRILLFGSAAKGTWHKDSDLDLLVIVRGPAHRRRLAQKIYRNLHGVDVPVDVVVATEDDVKTKGERVGNILRPALAEGRVIYDAQRG